MAVYEPPATSPTPRKRRVDASVELAKLIESVVTCDNGVLARAARTSRKALRRLTQLRSEDRRGRQVSRRAPQIRDDVAAHVIAHANPGVDGLLFPARQGVDRQIYGPTFADTFKRAARRAGLPDALRFHHLRHAGLTMLAQCGATLAELQARAGHATPGIAMRYQHTVAVRDDEIARALSLLAEG